MRASRLVPLFLVAALPAASALNGCGSAAPNKTGGSGGEEETGGSTGTGGKATGGSSGSTGGSSGSTGGSSGSTGGSSGSGGSAGGSGGSAGTGGAMGGSGGSGGAGGTTGACGMGRTKPASAVIDNFDGQSQVVEWLQADDMNTKGTKLMPQLVLKLNANTRNIYALGALAPWAMMNRPCMDASQYSGIQFTATGDVTALFFRVVTPATLPPGEGGTCTDPNVCFAHRQLNITDKLAGGGVIKVAFKDLLAPYGTPPPVDAASLISIIFRTTDMNPAHSFTIDNISFF